MNATTFDAVAGGIFGVVAVLQALRVVRRWEVLINGKRVPMWASAVGALVAGAMAVIAFRLQ
jgi:hypothetical protein